MWSIFSQLLEVKISSIYCQGITLLLVFKSEECTAGIYQRHSIKLSQAPQGRNNALSQESAYIIEPVTSADNAQVWFGSGHSEQQTVDITGYSSLSTPQYTCKETQN